MSSIKPKTGICPDCTGDKDVPLIAGRCQTHYWRSRMKPADPNPVMAQKPRTIKRQKPIQKESKEHRRRMAKYNPIAKAFKERTPICKAQLTGCTWYTTEVHHKRGKIGELLFDELHFLPACASCHRYIEDHPKEAKEMGLSEDRLS